MTQGTQKIKNQPQRTKFGVMAANQSQFWLDRILPVAPHFTLHCTACLDRVGALGAPRDKGCIMLVGKVGA
jgi:hypothetical protein